jgi:hypothetical protein
MVQNENVSILASSKSLSPGLLILYCHVELGAMLLRSLLLSQQSRLRVLQGIPTLRNSAKDVLRQALNKMVLIPGSRTITQILQMYAW